MAYQPLPGNPFTVPGSAAGFLDIRKQGTTGPVITVAVPAVASSSQTTLAAPANGQASATSTTSLSVTASSVAAASGYRLYTSAMQNGTYAQLGGLLQSPTYSHTGLSAAQQQWYKWMAVGNGTSYLDSPLSAAFSGTTQAVSGNTPPAPTTPVVDDTGNTFAASLVPNYTAMATNYEYTLNAGANWYTNSNLSIVNGTIALIVGNVAKAVGDVGIRVRANVSGGNPAGLPVYNQAMYTITSDTAIAAFKDLNFAALWTNTDRGWINYNNLFGADIPVIHTPGTSANDFKTVFSGDFSTFQSQVYPVGPAFGQEIDILNSFEPGRGNQNFIRLKARLSDGTQVGCKWDGATGQFSMHQRFLDVNNNWYDGYFFATSIVVTPRFKIGYIICDRSFTIAIKYPAGTVFPDGYKDTPTEVWIVTARQVLKQGENFDPRKKSFLQKIVGFDVDIASGGNEGKTFDIAGGRYGYMAGVGYANESFVRYSDGGFVENGQYALCGLSIPGPSGNPGDPATGIHTSIGGIVKVEIATGVIQQRNLLFVERIVNGETLIEGENSYDVTIDADNTSIVKVEAGSWGTNGEERQRIISYTLNGFPAPGPLVLTGGVDLAVTTNSNTNEDSSRQKRKDSSANPVWIMTFSDQSDFTLYYATSPNINGPFVNKASVSAGGSVQEGCKQFLADATDYVCATRFFSDQPESAYTIPVYKPDLAQATLTKVGQLLFTPIAQSVSPSHAALLGVQLPNGTTRYYGLLFDSVRFDGAAYSWGNSHMQQATTVQGAWEWPHRTTLFE